MQKTEAVAWVHADPVAVRPRRRAAETTGLVGIFPLPLQVTPLMAWLPSYRSGLGCWASMSPLGGSPRRPQGPTEGHPREGGEARALPCRPRPRACSLLAARGCPPLFDLFSPSAKSLSRGPWMEITYCFNNPRKAPFVGRLRSLPCWGAPELASEHPPHHPTSQRLLCAHQRAASAWAPEATEAQAVEMAWPRPLGHATRSRPRLRPSPEVRRVRLPPEALMSFSGSPSADRSAVGGPFSSHNSLSALKSPDTRQDAPMPLGAPRPRPARPASAPSQAGSAPWSRAVQGRGPPRRQP